MERRVKIVLDSTGAEQNANRFEASMTGAGAASDRTAFSVKKLAAAIGGLVVLRQATAFFSSAVKVAADFNAEMSKVAAVSGATAEELEDLTNIAREMGATTGFSASEAAGGLRFLSQAGFEAQESIEALPQVLSLAAAGGIGLANAADIASNIMSGFGAEASQTGDIVDVLAATASRANTNVDQLGQAMSFVAPISASLGVSIADTSAAIGVLSDAGIQGGRAGTSLRRVMTSLVNPTGEASAEIERLGLTLEDVNPDVNSITDVVNKFAEAGLNTSSAMKILGAEGGPALLALTSNNARLEELTENMNDAEGAAARMAEQMRDNLTGDTKALNSALEALKIQLGDTFTPQAREGVQGMTAAVRALANNLDTLLDIISVVSAAIGARLAVAIGTSAIQFAAQNRNAFAATRTMNSMGQVINRTTRAQNILNASMRTGSRLMGFLGGPVGIILTVAAAWVTYKNNANDAQEATEDLNRSLTDFTRTQAAAAIVRLTDRQAELRGEFFESSNKVIGLEATLQRMETSGRNALDVLSGRTIQDVKDELALARERSDDLEQSLANVGSRIRNLNLSLDISSIASIGQELFGEIDGFAQQTAESVEQSLTPVKSVIDQVLAAQEAVRSGVGAEDPFADPEGPGEPVDTSGGEAAREEMQRTTDELMRQLELRRQASTLNREANLISIQNEFERERALLNAQEQIRVAEEEEQNQLDKERRVARFEERLERLQLNDEREKELRAQFEEQELTREQLFEQRKTDILAEFSDRRIRLAEAERQANINIAADAASATLQILETFGANSTKIQAGQAIIQAGVAIEAGIAKALNNPFPQNLGFAAIVAGQGAKVITNLKKIASGAGGSGGVSTPSLSGSAGTTSQAANDSVNNTRNNLGQTQDQRRDRVIRVNGVDDESVVSGRLFKEFTEKLVDGEGFGRAIFGGS